MSSPIPVISIRQPMASEIIHGGRDGHRDVINLRKATKLRGDVLVYAFHALHDGTYAYYPTGLIIGRVFIVDCVHASNGMSSQWHETNMYGVYLADPVACLHVPHEGHPDGHLPPCCFDVDLDVLVPGKPAWQWYTDWLPINEKVA